MRKLSKVIFVGAILCFSFSLPNEDEKIVDLKIPSYTFSNWLEYEVLTLGEQNILLSITHQSGKVFHREERTLYGEAYLELDASDFPKGIYNISVKCRSIEVNLKTEKI
jgi:hypothetical protein